MWDYVDPEETMEMAGYMCKVTKLAFDKRGSRMATNGGDMPLVGRPDRSKPVGRIEEREYLKSGLAMIHACALRKLAGCDPQGFLLLRILMLIETEVGKRKGQFQMRFFLLIFYRSASARCRAQLTRGI